MGRESVIRVEETAERNPRERIGGNSPPPVERLPLYEMAKAEFKEAIDKHPEIRTRVDQLLDSASRATCTDDETMGRCTHLLVQIVALSRAVDREREQVKAPYYEASRIVDEESRQLLDRLLERSEEIRSMSRKYMRDKQQKLNDAVAAELAAKPARKSFSPAKKAPRATVRSEFGGTATAKAVAVAHIIDLDNAFGAVRTVPGVIEAIQKAIDALVRVGQRDIPGVEIEDEIGLEVRR